MEHNFLITGKPGSGKSTLIQKLMDRYPERNISGIVTPDIRRNHKRCGFKIIDIASGNEEILASVDIKSVKKVSKYGVDVEALDRIMDKLMESFPSTDIFMVDEIGKMELFSKLFQSTLKKIFTSNITIIATVGKQMNHPIKDFILNKPEVKLFSLTRQNQKEVMQNILEIINRA